MYIHIVSFKYAEKVTAPEQQEVYDRFLALQSLCKTQDAKPYIADLKAGRKNENTEGRGKGFDHTYIVTFEDAAGFQYYLNEDPAHQDFVTWVRPFLADAYIYDFEA